MTLSPTPTPDRFFSIDEERRICDHMNDDHADAVLRFAKVFGEHTNASSAKLTGLDRASMKIEVLTSNGQTTLSVPFTTALEAPKDAHVVIVKMSKEARREEARLQAQATAREFRENFQTVILSTCSAEGQPDASVAPAIWSEDDAFYTYISELSHHTQNLQETKQGSLMIIEDESASSQLLARRRLTFPCSATFISPPEDAYEAPMAQLKERFGKVMEHLAKMDDFHLVRLQPGTGRLVNGFGQAYDTDPMEWDQLQPAKVKGGGHRTREHGK